MLTAPSAGAALFRCSQNCAAQVRKEKHCGGFLLELLGDEAFRRRGELEPQAVALVLNAHARLQMSNPVLFDP